MQKKKSFSVLAIAIIFWFSILIPNMAIADVNVGVVTEAAANAFSVGGMGSATINDNTSTTLNSSLTNNSPTTVNSSLTNNSPSEASLEQSLTIEGSEASLELTQKGSIIPVNHPVTPNISSGMHPEIRTQYST